jgi:hypothetical protein
VAHAASMELKETNEIFYVIIVGDGLPIGVAETALLASLWIEEAEAFEPALVRVAKTEGQRSERYQQLLADIEARAYERYAERMKHRRTYYKSAPGSEQHPPL